MNIRLIKLLTLSSLKSRYRKTFAGIIWVALNPILLFTAQALVFKFVLKVDIENYPLYLLTGLLPWTFISSTLEMTTPQIVMNKDLFKSFKLSPINIILSYIFDNAITFLFTLSLVMIPCFFIYDLNLINILIMLIAFIPLFIGISAIALALSVLNVFFRDIRFLVSFILNLLFYVTPIFYTIDMFPEKYQFLFNLNPFYILISPFRNAIYALDYNLFAISFFKAISLSLILIIFSNLIWKSKKEKVNLYV